MNNDSTHLPGSKPNGRHAGSIVQLKKRRHCTQYSDTAGTTLSCAQINGGTGTCINRIVINNYKLPRRTVIPPPQAFQRSPFSSHTRYGLGGVSTDTDLPRLCTLLHLHCQASMLSGASNEAEDEELRNNGNKVIGQIPDFRGSVQKSGKSSPTFQRCLLPPSSRR
jgi:hypothetical protein